MGGVSVGFVVAIDVKVGDGAKVGVVVIVGIGVLEAAAGAITVAAGWQALITRVSGRISNISFFIVRRGVQDEKS